MKRYCVQIDLDGTLCNIDHRLHHVRGNKKDWKAFFEGIPYDTANEPVRTLAWLHRWYGYDVVFLSGRPEDYRIYTDNWLDRNFGGNYHLYMRSSGDYRADWIVKDELYEKYVKPYWDVYFAVDDRPSVCDVWRKKGIFLFDVGSSESELNSIRKGDLHIFVGPSGAGKTTVAESLFNRDVIVSSDRVRELILDNPTDMSQNDKVFDVVHKLSKERVDLGLLTVVDATNIRNKDRKALVELVDNDVDVTYHVVNRPVEEKIETGGWRNQIDGLIERHENTFQSNLKDILNGDGYSNVKVKDHRRSS